jgi:hypothetical protein
MFEDLRNTGDDHFGGSSDLIPEHNPLINLEDGDEDGDSEDVSSEEEEVTPPKGKGKRIVGAENDKGKRTKTSDGQWMQDQVSKMCCSMRGLQHQSSQCWQERRRPKGRPLKK